MTVALVALLWRSSGLVEPPVLKVVGDGVGVASEEGQSPRRSVVPASPVGVADPQSGRKTARSETSSKEVSGEGSLIVRVTNEAGQPIAGCAIMLLPATARDGAHSFQNAERLMRAFRDERPLSTEMTDHKGGAVFSTLQPGSFRVAAFLARRAATFSEFVEVQEGSPAPRVLMQLRKGFVASGVVVDTDGKPIVGAEVAALEVTGEPDDDRPTLKQVTNSAGQFRFDMLTKDQHRIIVRAKGFAVGGEAEVWPDQAGIHIVLHPAGRIVAHVFDEVSKEGIEGASVAVHQEDWLSVGSHQGGGVYFLDGIPPCSVISLFVRTAEYEFSESLGMQGFTGEARFDHPVVPGEMTRIEIPMSRLGSVQGRVVDQESGAAIAGAEVRVLSGFEVDAPRAVTGMTDENGLYTLSGVVSGSLLLVARSSGYQAVTVGEQPWKSGAARGEPLIAVKGQRVQVPLIEMSRGRSVKGHVVDSAGQPVGGAVVGWAVDSLGVPSLDRLMETDRRSVLSAVDGSFELNGLSEGEELVLTASHPEFKGGGQGKVGGFFNEGVKIVMSRGGTIHGQLLLSTGQPLALANLQCSRGGQTVMTDSNGMFQMDGVPCGSVRLQLAGGTAARLDQESSRPIVVIDGETIRVTLRVSAMPGISGHVVDENGQPIEAAGIRIAGKESVSAQSDLSGEFTLSFVPKGRHTLFIWRDGYRSVQLSGVDAGTRDVAVTMVLDRR